MEGREVFCGTVSFHAPVTGIVTMTTRMALLVTLLAVVALSFAVGDKMGKPGCTAPYLLPNEPFFVVWNVPSHGCDQGGITLNFSKYGIVTNKDDDWFGDSSVLFYGLGAFPYLGKSGPVNGGIPQLANLSYHFGKVISDITTLVPIEFDGVAIIDMESWQPVFSQNSGSYRPYQTASIDLVKKEHPDWNQTQLYNEAAQQFEAAARTLLEETLMLAKALRPMGHWGYYHFPFCFGVDKDNASLCGNTYPDDQLAWLWKASSGLFPSVYLYNAEKTPAEAKYSYILRSFTETLRVSAKYSDPDTPIFMYSFVQDAPLSFFNLTDLGFAIGEPADLGASGVLIWGSSGAFHQKGECQALQQYLDTTLGPYVKSVTDFAATCSQKLCSGHGRCVRVDYDLWYQTQAFLAGQSQSCGGQRWDGILGSANKTDVTQDILSEMRQQLENGDLLLKLSLMRRGHTLSLPELLRIKARDLQRKLQAVDTKEGFSVLHKSDSNSLEQSMTLEQALKGNVRSSSIAREILEFLNEATSPQGGKGRKVKEQSRLGNYACRCLYGWFGADCSQRG